jgi:hypothetical protein
VILVDSEHDPVTFSDTESVSDHLRNRHLTLRRDLGCDIHSLTPYLNLIVRILEVETMVNGGHDAVVAG